MTIRAATALAAFRKPFVVALARELTRSRERRGLQQGELARKLAFSQPQLCRYEAAQNEPSITTFVAWCEALELEPHDVLRAVQKRAAAYAAMGDAP